jgi:hypothetical protein
MASDRLRAVQVIKETNPDFNLNVTVHRFLEDWHNCYYLHTDSDGTKMTEYEDLGEKLKWKHDRNNNNSGSINSDLPNHRLK